MTGSDGNGSTVTGSPDAGPGAATTAGISLEAAARARDADLPTGAEKTVLVQSMFDAIAPRYDLVNRTMTFGLDVRWRKQSLKALGPPARVHRARPGLRHRRLPQDPRATAATGPFGMDLSWGMLAANRTGLPLAQADGAALPVATASVDGITCGYALRNFTELGAVFHEFGRDRASGRADQPARGVRARLGPPAPRSPHLVPPGGARHRRAAVGPLGLPVPPEVDRLPAVHR